MHVQKGNSAMQSTVEDCSRASISGCAVIDEDKQVLLTQVKCPLELLLSALKSHRERGPAGQGPVATRAKGQLRGTTAATVSTGWPIRPERFDRCPPPANTLSPRWLRSAHTETQHTHAAPAAHLAPSGSRAGLTRLSLALFVSPSRSFCRSLSSLSLSLAW